MVTFSQKNSKALNQIIQDIIQDNYESIITDLWQTKVRVQHKEKIITDLKDEIYKLRQENIRLSWNLDIIKQYENDTWRYYVVDPIVEETWPEWECDIVWIEIFEVTKDWKEKIM